MYDPELGIHLGHKLWTNQQYNALQVYKNIDSKSGDILEKILDWDGTLDEFSTETSTLFPIFSANNLDAIEKELQHSAKNHFNSKEHRYVIKHQKVIFPAYRMKNPRVRSIISYFKNTKQ